jgi:shikimate kinase
MDVITQHTSKVVYLDTSIQVLVERLLKEKNDRPVIAHLDSKESLTEFVGKHLFERRPFYRKAPIIIAIQNQYPSEVVQQIVDSL